MYIRIDQNEILYRYFSRNSIQRNVKNVLKEYLKSFKLIETLGKLIKQYLSRDRL